MTNGLSPANPIARSAAFARAMAGGCPPDRGMYGVVTKGHGG